MSQALSWVGEPMEKHLEAMLELWEGKYRRFYERPLQRLLRLEVGDADRIVKAAVILHDVGKLTERYQRYLEAKARGESARLGYRHEMLSAAVAFLTFASSPWRPLLSAAVLLHHEPILMGQTGRLGEEYVTLTRAYSMFRLVASEDRVELHPGGVDLINRLLEREGFSEKAEPVYGRSQLEGALKDCVARVALRSDRGLVRVKVAALTHVLTLLDSKAASARSGDEGGTFVSRRAAVAEVAELCA